jgi:hypothetical protein
MKKLLKAFAAFIAGFATIVASAGAINYGAEQGEYLYVVSAVITLATLGIVVFKNYRKGV